MTSTSLIVPLEIAKLAFFVAYVVATIGVIIGVYWEEERFPKEKQQRGWRLLIGSLALDTLFTIFIFGTDGWIGSIQRAQIILLEARLAPRTLTPAAMTRVADKLKQFGPQSYDLSVPPTLEPGSNLQNVLLGVLSNQLGWKLESFPSGMIPTRMLLPLELVFSKKTSELGNTLPTDKIAVGVSAGIVGVHVEFIKELMQPGSNSATR
jgi:hypothetical protein